MVGGVVGQGAEGGGEEEEVLEVDRAVAVEVRGVVPDRRAVVGPQVGVQGDEKPVDLRAVFAGSKLEIDVILRQFERRRVSGQVQGDATPLPARAAARVPLRPGDDFAVEEMGPFTIPAAADLPTELWRKATIQRTAALLEEEREPTPDAAILELLEQREAARRAREWAEADRLRAEIESAGWQIKDTPEGPILAAQ